jgi:adenosine deaminase
MLTKDVIRRLPKAELHVHLDGCLRPQTMIELAQTAGVRLPGGDPQSLADAMFVRNAKNLEEYLDRYTYTVALMQTEVALERISYEFVHDAFLENVRYVEVRFCPALHTTSLQLSQVMEAVLAGLRRAETETGTRATLIVTALRTMAPSVSSDLAHLAVDYREEGSVAFDLAGAERHHPARDHAAAFAHAARHGLHCTCHAGEGDGPDSVRQALHDCGAQRIGHGTRIHEDTALERQVCEAGIPLEMCLSSNLHTRTVTDVASHPLRRYFDRGCVVTLNTDSRLMDGVSLTDEYWLAHTALGFSRSELDRLILNGFESAFLPDDEKTALVARVTRELQEIP